MSRIYTRPFAEYYDMRAELLARSADQEVEFFRFVFDSFARIQVRVILDVGCGTGRHYIPLSQEGYDVTGLDGSQNMLNVLKRKLEKSEAAITGRDWSLRCATKLKLCVSRKDMRKMEEWANDENKDISDKC